MDRWAPRARHSDAAIKDNHDAAGHRHSFILTYQKIRPVLMRYMGVLPRENIGDTGIVMKRQRATRAHVTTLAAKVASINTRPVCPSSAVHVDNLQSHELHLPTLAYVCVICFLFLYKKWPAALSLFFSTSCSLASYALYLSRSLLWAPRRLMDRVRTMIDWRLRA